MRVEKSLAGTDRLYLAFDKLRISLKDEDGLWKVHIPIEAARVEDNRVVVLFTKEELREIATAINEITR